VAVISLSSVVYFCCDKIQPRGGAAVCVVYGWWWCRVNGFLPRRWSFMCSDKDNDACAWINGFTLSKLLLIFTALHGMQAIRKLSVRLSNAWIVTKQKKDLSRFLYCAKDHLA